MAQVKFYATTSASYSALGENVDTGGIYFVEGGELYKGSARFGLGRVTVAASTAGIENAARGDIVVTGSGAGWVYDGGEWRSIGGDVGSLTSAWRADISASLAGLSVGNANSYITSITQAEDGSVTANAVAFPALDTGDNDGEVKLGSDAAKVSGWDTVKTDISNLQAVVSYSGSGDSVVTATTGNFTNLNVSDSATFSATTVSATTLTVGGSTIEQLADKQIAAIASHTETSTALGITVSVTTSAGSVSGVYVDATSFGNAMHFVGVKASTGEVASPASGDIIVIGSEPATGFVAGQEYIYDGNAWELIGDQATYATKAAVEASWDTLGTAAFVDTATTVAADATTLPTGGAVASYVSSAITSAIDALAGSASDSDKGIAVEVVTADGEVSTVDVAVTAASTMALNATGSADELATTAAIKSFYDNNLVWLDANGDAIA